MVSSYAVGSTSQLTLDDLFSLIAGISRLVVCNLSRAACPAAMPTIRKLSQDGLSIEARV